MRKIEPPDQAGKDEPLEALTRREQLAIAMMYILTAALLAFTFAYEGGYVL